MTIKGSGRRVLRFAVTGALLGGASCDSDKETTTSPADSKSDVEPKKAETKAGETKTGETKTGETKTADGGPEEPQENVNPGPEVDVEPEPVEDNVNTQKIEEPVPEPVPELREPKYVNTRQVEEPEPVLEEPKPTGKKPVTRTNTGRVPEPKGR